MQQLNAEIVREEHRNRADEILGLLNSISSWYRADEEADKSAAANAKAFDELARKLREDEYTIVVVGEFSAGKSTLLNALMGERLLPAFSSETTATVNYLYHSDKAKQGEKGCVFYNDGTTKILNEVNLEIIQKYVSTRGKDVGINVTADVAHLDLYLESDFLRDNVVIVDSPGLNGIKEGHAEITDEQILESHACIFVFTATQPGSESNFKVLKQIESKVDTILFVLNKIDEIKQHEGDTPESIVEEVKEAYKEAIPDKECPEIWPLAAMPALAARSKLAAAYYDKAELSDNEKEALLVTSRIQEFETRLMEFLTKGEKTRDQFLGPVERMIRVATKSKDEIENRIHVLEKAEDTGEIKKRIDTATDTITELKAKESDCYTDVNKDVRTELKYIIANIDADIIKYTDRAVSELEVFDNVDDLNDYVKNIYSGFTRHVKNTAEKYDEKLRESILENILEEKYKAFAASIQKGLDETHSNLNIALELNSREYTFDVGIEEMNRQDAELKRQLDELQLQEEEARKRRIDADANLRKQKEIKEQLLAIEDQRAVVDKRQIDDPDKTSKKIKREQARGGILGKVVDLLVGKKMVFDEIEVIDDTKFKADVARREEDLKRLGAEKEKLAVRLNDSAEGELLRAADEYDRVCKELERFEDEYRKKQEKNREEFQLKYNTKIRRVKNELRNQLADDTDEIIIEVKKTLNGQEKMYSEIVCSMIVANIRQSLANEQRKLENLQASLEGSQKERDEQISKLTGRLKELTEILCNAEKIKNELKELKK